MPADSWASGPQPAASWRGVYHHCEAFRPPSHGDGPDGWRCWRDVVAGAGRPREVRRRRDRWRRPARLERGGLGADTRPCVKDNRCPRGPHPHPACVDRVPHLCVASSAPSGLMNVDDSDYSTLALRYWRHLGRCTMSQPARRSPMVVAFVLLPYDPCPSWSS